MKRLDLLPTETNVINTFLEDEIERNSYVLSFVNMINSIEGGYSIAVDGAWGSGKTFFIKQTKLVLDAINPSSNISKSEDGKKILVKWKSICKNEKLHELHFVTSYYDAWCHDDEEDPLLSLIYSMMQEFSYLKTDPNKRDWVEIISKLGDLLSGSNVSDYIKALQGENIYKNTEKSIAIKNLVDSFLGTIVKANDCKLVVFVDELDRCSPVFAIKLLERIKHYLLNDSIIFVFSINQVELQKTIKNFYGVDFDACRYLDRFFDCRIVLPEVEPILFMNTLGINNYSKAREDICFEFIKQTKMSLREMSKYLYASKMAAYGITDAEEKNKRQYSAFESGYTTLVVYNALVPIAIGLKNINITDYYNFINGKDVKWLESILLSERICDWVFQYLLERRTSNCNLDDNEKKEIIKKLYDAIFVEKHDTSKTYQTTIGSVIIDGTVKTRILEAVNYASKYTDFLC